MSIYQYPKTLKKLRHKPVEMATGNIAKRWRELSGQKRWQGLLNPLDKDMRQYLINYGQLAQATYDTFIWQTMSRFAGRSRYNKSVMFHHVGLVKNNPFKYNPVNYLYATSALELPQSFIIKPNHPLAWSKKTNWMGYIAVADDNATKALGRRDIVVAWRGTIQPEEWVKDFDFPLKSASDVLGINKPARLHEGFLSLYTSKDPRSKYSSKSARQQVFEGLKGLVNKYQNEKLSITVTGHSLGASLATICAADIVANGLNRSDKRANKGCPVTAFVYACPRTGDRGFRKACDSMEDLRILRIRNKPDIVPKVPPLIVGFSEVGQQLLVDTRKSTFLKFPGDFISWHNLEVYLLAISRMDGSKAGSSLVCDRDIALANKHADVLKEKYMVPASWWCEKHNGMTQGEDGSWKLHDYHGANDSDDDHSHNDSNNDHGYSYNDSDNDHGYNDPDNDDHNDPDD